MKPKFIRVTHARMQNPMFIRADKIVEIRDYGNQTLVITENGRGCYILEPEEMVLSKINEAFEEKDNE